MKSNKEFILESDKKSERDEERQSEDVRECLLTEYIFRNKFIYCCCRFDNSKFV